jgi:hypothetical protein
MGGKEIEREGWRGFLAISNLVVEEFLTHLAVEENVAASTQNQAITTRFYFCIRKFSSKS